MHHWNLASPSWCALAVKDIVYLIKLNFKLDQKNIYKKTKEKKSNLLSLLSPLHPPFPPPPLTSLPYIWKRIPLGAYSKAKFKSSTDFLGSLMLWYASARRPNTAARHSLEKCGDVSNLQIVLVIMSNVDEWTKYYILQIFTK